MCVFNVEKLNFFEGDYISDLQYSKHYRVLLSARNLTFQPELNFSLAFK